MLGVPFLPPSAGADTAPRLVPFPRGFFAVSSPLPVRNNPGLVALNRLARPLRPPARARLLPRCEAAPPGRRAGLFLCGGCRGRDRPPCFARAFWGQFAVSGRTGAGVCRHLPFASVGRLGHGSLLRRVPSGRGHASRRFLPPSPDRPPSANQDGQRSHRKPRGGAQPLSGQRLDCCPACASVARRRPPGCGGACSVAIAYRARARLQRRPQPHRSGSDRPQTLDATASFAPLAVHLPASQIATDKRTPR